MDEKRFQLILDDSGSRNPDHKPEAREDGMDWFALGGFLVEEEDVRLLIDQHQAFVNAWGIDYPLHSTRIRGRRNNFRWLGRDAGRAAHFYEELSVLLTKVPVLGIACVIDRPGYNGRYAEKYGDDRWLMCKTAFAILVERSAKYAISQGGKLEVYFEGVGPKEDQNLIGYHRDLKKAGMPFDRDRSGEYESLDAKAFTEVLLGDAQRQTKASPLMQIADLYLYPMVKAGYGPYKPYDQLVESGRIIDTHLDKGSQAQGSIKYSCFERVKKA